MDSMNTVYSLYDFIYTLCAFVMALAVTLVIMAKFLDRSNNMGDSSNTFNDHVPRIYSESARTHESRKRANDFVLEYGRNPFENDDSKAPDMLKLNDDIYGEVEDVDIPLFKPL